MNEIHKQHQRKRWHHHGARPILAHLPTGKGHVVSVGKLLEDSRFQRWEIGEARCCRIKYSNINLGLPLQGSTLELLDPHLKRSLHSAPSIFVRQPECRNHVHVFDVGSEFSPKISFSKLLLLQLLQIWNALVRGRWSRVLCLARNKSSPGAEGVQQSLARSVHSDCQCVVDAATQRLNCLQVGGRTPHMEHGDLWLLFDELVSHRPLGDDPAQSGGPQSNKCC